MSVVHGDFRLGNFMWDDNGILAMLDWEQCHLGDPLEEIAFMYWPLWSLEPLIPIDEIDPAATRRPAAIAVDRETLAFYRAFIELKMSVVLLTGIRSFFATDERQVVYGAMHRARDALPVPAPVRRRAAPTTARPCTSAPIGHRRRA